MKQNRLKKWMAPLLLLGVIVLTGCVDKDNPVVADVQVVMPEGINLTEIQPYETDFELNITSDTEWSIDNDEDICLVYPYEGTGNAKISVRILENSTGEDRNTTISIKFPNAKDNNQQIVVKQLGFPTIFKDEQEDINMTQAVGYGYNIYGEIGSSSVVSKIFDVEKLDKDKRIAYQQDQTVMSFRSVTGSSVREMSAKLSTSMGLKANYMGFSSEIKASFDAEYLNSETSEYALTYFYMEKYKKRINTALEDIADEESGYIDKIAYAAINDNFKKSKYPSTDDGFFKLLQNYGTHVVKEARLGAYLRRSMAVDVTQVEGNFDINAFAMLSYGDSILEKTGTYAKIEAEYKESFKNNQSSCHGTVHVLGGDDSFKNTLSSTTCSQSDIQAWINSVDKNTAAPISFREGDLIPIYKLVEDNERREALKQYMESGRYRDRYNKAIDMEYDYRPPTKVEIPTFEDGDNLIKNIKYGGMVVARVCNEYIPAIHTDERVTVVYPVVEGHTLWNLGYYIGSETRTPAKVCTTKGKITAITLKDDDGKELPKGTRKTLYIQGSTISDALWSEDIDPYQTESEDYFINGYVDPKYADPGPNGYGIVKIFDKLWLTYNFRGITAVGNDPITHAENDQKPKYYFYQPWNIKNELISGWRIPATDDFLSINNTLTSREIYDVADKLEKGGVIGFQLEHVNKNDCYQGVYVIKTDDNKNAELIEKKRCPDLDASTTGCYFGCVDGAIVIQNGIGKVENYKDLFFQIRLCKDI